MSDFLVRTDPTDRLTIGDHHYIVAKWESGVVELVRVNDPDYREKVPASTMREIWDRSDFRFEAGYFSPDSSTTETPIAAPTISTLNKRDRDTALYRLAYVQGYMRLMAQPHSPYKRTYQSAAAAARALQPEVDGLGTFAADDVHLIATDNGGSKKRKGRVGTPMPDDQGRPQILALCFPSGETLLKWFWAYRDSGGDPMSLRPAYGRCGYFGSHLAPEVEATISRVLADYFLTKDRPSEPQFLEKVRGIIKARNKQLRDAGQTPYAQPGLSAIRRAIGRLSPYYIDSRRYGEDYARAAHPWNTEGFEINVPGQRVEIDAYEVDVVTLMTISNFWHGLTDEERASVKKKRLWLTIAIDRATRCIVGMRLSETPTVPNAIRTLEMIESDKSHLGQGAGTTSTWHHRCGVMTVVADGGYVSSEIRAAMADVRGTIEYPQSGNAAMRAMVERIFGTVAQDLMRRLHGRTFSNIVQRGTYDAEANACLTVDELSWLLVTWVVDIYHNTPHEGLKLLTPNQAWDEATAKYGVHPWRDSHGRRAAFGVRLERKLRAGGFEFMGNRYQDDDPQGLRNLYLNMPSTHDRRYEICVDEANIGAISVIVDEVAIAIPCRDPKMEGISLADWIETTEQLRRDTAGRTEVPREIAHEALRRVERKNEEAGMRRGIAETVYSAEELGDIEKRNFSHFRYVDEPDVEPSDILGVSIGSLDTPPNAAPGLQPTAPATTVPDSDDSGAADPPPDDGAWPMED